MYVEVQTFRHLSDITPPKYPILINTLVLLLPSAWI